MSPRWHKVLADLAVNKSRSVLVILCIAIGVIAVGMIEGARQMLANTLAASYNAAQPATISFHLSPFDDSLVTVMRRSDGVRAAQGIRLTSVRARTKDGVWHDIQLTSAKNFSSAGVNQILSVQGNLPPPLHQLALEQSSLASLHGHIGDLLLLELPDGKQTTVSIAGTVHDLNQASTFLTGALYGYATPETLTWLGLDSGYNQLEIRADDTQPRQALVDLSAKLRNDLQERGYLVSSTNISPVPGRLFFADSVQAMMLLLITLGIVSVCSSAILVVTTISALLAQQIRELGIMKAIGAPTSTLLQMYLVTILLFSLFAILLAIPLGALGAYIMVLVSIRVLNLLPVSFELVPNAIALQIATGLLIPSLAAFVPVLIGSRISVSSALASYGLGGGDFGPGFLDRMIERLRSLPRPLLLSLRNAFRRKGRLVLTLSTLLLSGAVFMALLTVRASLYTTLKEMDAFRQGDFELILGSAPGAARIAREIQAIHGVVGAEMWGWGEADLRRADAKLGERLDVFGVPLDSHALQPTLLQGRWFAPADQNAMVVDADVLKIIPNLVVGDRVLLERNGNESIWVVVGVARDRLRGPLAYVPYPAWTRTQNEIGLTERVQVFTNAHDAASQTAIARTVEAALKSNHVPVVSVQTGTEQHDSDQSNFDSIISFLTAMGILLAIVGGLGLMGTMGLNVLERTREIGVLRAIGAPSPALIQIVVVEGVLTASMSFPFAVLLSLPLALVLNDFVGHQLIQASLAFTISWRGLAVWLGMLIVIAALSSFVPAYNAIRLTVRNALAYE